VRRETLIWSAAGALLVSCLPGMAHAEGEADQLDQIVVTAQRREQTLEEVPLSVRVIESSEIEARRIRTPEEAFDSSANVQFNLFGDGADGAGIAVRGVSAAGVFGVDQAVPIYVDGVLLGSEASFNPRLLDIDRIEILRGPQGTLYGRDALGGAVSIVTTRPDPSGISGYVEGSLASYDERGLKGVVNLPTGADSALRLAAYGVRSDGYVKNVQGGPRFMNLDEAGARAQWLFRPTERWELVLSGDYSEDHGRKYGVGPAGTVAQTLSVDIAIPFLGKTHNAGAALSSTFKGDSVDVISITGWRNSGADGMGGNFSVSPLTEQGYDRRYSQLSEELRVISHPGGWLDWVAGAYAFGYREHRVDFDGFNFEVPADSFFPGQPTLPAGYQEASTPRIDTRNYALFGDATAHLGRDWDLIAGARVNYDDRRIHYDQHSTEPGFSIFAPIQVLDQRVTDTSVEPRFGLTYKALSSLNLYTTVSRGYKSGGFNPSFAASADLYYKPESGWNYEAGMKGSAFGRRVTFSASVFDFEWSNKQAYYWNGFFVTIANAPKARSYGGEGQVDWLATERLQLGAQIGLLHATLTEFPQAGNSSTGTPTDATGFRLPLAPSFSGNLSAQYSQPVGDGAKLVARVDYNYRSRFYFDVLQLSPQAGYGLLNTGLTYDIARWSVTVYGRNLTDERYLSYAYNTTEGVPGEPRIFGIAARVKF
jgi:iron complex outermembrane recepter protein